MKGHSTSQLKGIGCESFLAENETARPLTYSTSILRLRFDFTSCPRWRR